MTFTCHEHCGECCGIVPLPIATFEKNKDKATHIKELIADKKFTLPITEDQMCCFLDEHKKCKIYKERPKVCHEYGINEKLPCPYYHPDGTKRSRQNRRHTQREINKEIDKKIKTIQTGYFSSQG